MWTISLTELVFCTCSIKCRMYNYYILNMSMYLRIYSSYSDWKLHVFKDRFIIEKWCNFFSYRSSLSFGQISKKLLFCVNQAGRNTHRNTQTISSLLFTTCPPEKLLEFIVCAAYNLTLRLIHGYLWKVFVNCTTGKHLRARKNLPVFDRSARNRL